MLWQRVVTALVLLPLLILAIFGLVIEAFAIIIAIVICIASWEWSGFITRKTHHRAVYVLSVALFIWLIQSYSLPMAYWHGFIMPETLSEWFGPNKLVLQVLALGALWWLFALILLIIYPKLSQGLVEKPFLMIPVGWLMLVPTWIGAVGIRSMGIEFDPSHGAKILLFVLLIVWAADTGAYFSGKTFGKHKLAPKVSPKKTWEGVYGGAALSILVLVLGIYLLHFEREQWLSLAFLTGIIVAFSIVGDLTESIFKRLTGVKDSGKILPGHGGVLDRIDGITAVLPLTLLGFSLLGIK